MTDWITCEDRLPGFEDVVDYIYDDQFCMKDNVWYDRFSKKWQENGPMDFYGDYPYKVTHWFPKPKPPKDKT